jgi:hypothetical protein
VVPVRRRCGDEHEFAIPAASENEDRGAHCLLKIHDTELPHHLEHASALVPLRTRSDRNPRTKPRCTTRHRRRRPPRTSAFELRYSPRRTLIILRQATPVPFTPPTTHRVRSFAPSTDPQNLTPLDLLAAPAGHPSPRQNPTTRTHPRPYGGGGWSDSGSGLFLSRPAGSAASYSRDRTSSSSSNSSTPIEVLSVRSTAGRRPPYARIR